MIQKTLCVEYKNHKNIAFFPILILISHICLYIFIYAPMYINIGILIYILLSSRIKSTSDSGLNRELVLKITEYKEIQWFMNNLWIAIFPFTLRDVYIHIYIYIYMYELWKMYACMSIYIYVCIHIYIYMYIFFLMLSKSFRFWPLLAGMVWINFMNYHFS
jgi:hypothetical protein